MLSALPCVFFLAGTAGTRGRECTGRDSGPLRHLVYDRTKKVESATKAVELVLFAQQSSQCSSTVKSRIIGLCAMSLELPPLVRSGVFLFFYVSQKG